MKKVQFIKASQAARQRALTILQGEEREKFSLLTSRIEELLFDPDTVGKLLKEFSALDIKIFREQIAADILGRTSSAQLTPRQARSFRSAAKFIDLILEPEAAESAIGDLAEGYQRRAPLDGGHSIRWLWAQVARLTFDRALAVVSRVVRARAGK